MTAALRVAAPVLMPNAAQGVPAVRSNLRKPHIVSKKGEG